MSAAEDLLAFHLEAAGYGDFVREHRFCDRKWRFDFAWLDPLRLALEVEGGLHVGGRHVRGKGYEADLEKYNTAAVLGWKIIRVSPAMVKSGEALHFVECAMLEATAE